MWHPSPDPQQGLVWWTDATNVACLTAHEIRAWLERGISSGWIVLARSPEEALAKGRRSAWRTNLLTSTVTGVTVLL